ncbi:Protein VTS1 [Grifola frondosa]|uniref:Protein VTS1 n=1 Tax=Grifola frondosa TaxID=5627 RepID=A0A1C7M3V2_GRIFR|nr:Protein VTS1 [Grifola frondosa]
MSSLAPPSPSVSPGPAGNANGRSPNFRASMGPFCSSFPEAIDQWFETFQNYEVTLEEMAAASLDVNFKEELSAIEQWFKVLSEAERTAALYSLLQHSTQVQIRPAVGGSMQSQMEAKLASMNLKSPGLKSNLPGSPTARNFSGLGNSFLSPDSANNVSAGGDPAATLAQQRAKLKASNAAHRISAPALATTVGADGRNTWGGSGSSQLSQVDERASSPGQEISISASNSIISSRPKSTDFSGVANAFKSPRSAGEDGLSPMAGDSWASMVNTPLMPMFKDTRNAGQSLDAAAAKLNDWTAGGSTGLNDNAANGIYGDDGNLVGQGAQHNGQRNVSGGLRNASGAGNLNGFGGQGGWGGARSPALSNTSGRFSDDGGLNGLGMAGFGMGLGNPALGMPGEGSTWLHSLLRVWHP